MGDKYDKKKHQALKAILSSEKATAQQKIDAKNTILKNMKEKMDLDDYDTKRANEQLNNEIKKGNLKKTGAIDSRGLSSKGFRAGAKSGAKTAGKSIAKKISKKLLSSIPFVGGLASAVSSGDVSAAVPILGDSDSTGPKKGSLDAKLEDPSISMEERKKIHEIIKKRRNKK